MNIPSIPLTLAEKLGKDATSALRHWVNQVYDIQSVKLTGEATLSLVDRINSVKSELKEDISGVKSDLIDKIDTKTARIEEKVEKLSDKIDSHFKHTTEETSKLIDKMDSHFKWILGIMITLWGVPITGAVIYLILNKL